MAQDGAVKSKYIYRIYGIDVISDFLLPELTPGTKGADIRILRGKVPRDVYGALEKNKLFQVSANELLFQIKGAGKYYIENGNLIVVEPEEGANFDTVKIFLLGTALGALLLQRGIIPIHGSAVVINKKCVIFTGESGAGKSTLSSALIRKGCSLLTDDVAALTIDKDGCIMVQPGYPQQKLWRDYIESMGGDVDSLIQINTETDKYAVPVRKDFMESPVPLAAVCELKAEECENAHISEITGVHKLSLLMNNTYRVQLLRFFDSKTNHFKQCSAIANKVAVYSMVRPKDRFSTEEQIRLIMDKFSNMQDDLIHII